MSTDANSACEGCWILQSSPPPRRPPPPLSSASSRSQWALPDPRLPDPSGHRRTSAESSRSQWALPDFSCDCQIAVGTAGLESRAPDSSGHCRASVGHCRTSAATARFQRIVLILRQNGKILFLKVSLWPASIRYF
eukprot:s3742_g2.t1